MTSPRFAFHSILEHEIHVTEWGDPANPPLVMWHGLARTGRDFDELAVGLSDRWFVLCPDTIGRGWSSWSKNPEAEYSIEYLTGIAVDLLDQYDIDKAAWIGTSMGGLIGMRMASGPLASRLTKLVINDIGPEIPQAAIDRIGTYAGDQPTFDTVQAMEDWLKTIYAPFGTAPDSFWRRMTLSSIRRRDDGRITLHYDPKLILQFTVNAHELTTWDRYAKITLPTHVVWGMKSDVLPASVVERMRAEGPKPSVTEFPEFGHAPSLSREEDIALVRKILDDLG